MKRKKSDKDGLIFLSHEKEDEMMLESILVELEIFDEQDDDIG